MKTLKQKIIGILEKYADRKKRSLTLLKSQIQIFMLIKY